MLLREAYKCTVVTLWSQALGYCINLSQEEDSSHNPNLTLTSVTSTFKPRSTYITTAFLGDVVAVSGQNLLEVVDPQLRPRL